MRFLRAVLPLAVLAVGAAVVLPVPASAATVSSSYTVLLPAVTDITPNHTPSPILSTTLYLQQGEQRRVQSQLVLTNTSGRAAEVDNELRCINQEDGSVVMSTSAGTNIMPSGAAPLVLQENLLLGAGTAGNYTCMIVPETGDEGRSYVLKALTNPFVSFLTTYLQISTADEPGAKAWIYNTCPSAGNDPNANNCIYLGGYNDPMSAVFPLVPWGGGDTTWTARPDATNYSLAGVIQVTSCPSGTKSCRTDQGGSGQLDDNGVPVTTPGQAFQPAKFQTWIDTTQLYPDGSPCANHTTMMPTYTVDKSVHHFPVVYDDSGTISALCQGSRTFRIQVSFKYLGGDAVKLDEGEIDVINSVRTTATTVPNLLPLNASAASAALSAAGLVPHPTSFMNPAPAGTILGQNSPGGISEPVGSTVNYSVSLGQSIIPALSRASQDAANTAIINAGLVVGTVSQSDDCLAPGTVENQNPAPGGFVVPGTAVNYTVSTCVNHRLVPNLYALSPDAANTAIANAGLAVGSTGQRADCLAPGSVENQTPGSGTLVGLGAVVSYTVSTCPPPPPGGDGTGRKPQ